jgi:organic hydroperoxide reductase OsmC/OhrA
MATHTVQIKWAAKESGEEFLKGRFSRAHTISFDGGTTLPASASPHVVGKWAVEAAVDPEEMLVAALSSCHMLSFLHLARVAGFAVAAYGDHAEGVLEEVAPGRQAITKAMLRPKIEWAGKAPDEGALARLHREAHEICFIANSVKTRVTVE